MRKLTRPYKNGGATVEEEETKQRSEFRKYDISIDQFRERQWVKNPIASWNLLVLSVMYFALSGIAIPLAFKGIAGCSF